MRNGVFALLTLALLGGGATLYAGSDVRPLRPAPQISPAIVSAGEPGPIEVPLSTVFLPLSIPIAAIQNRLNEVVPGIFSGSSADPVRDSAVVEDTLSWVARRGPIHVNGGEGQLWLWAGARGDASVRGKLRPLRGKVGKILRRATGGASDIPFHVHADALAGLTATIRPELLSDWRIKPNISAQVGVLRAEVPIGGIARVDVRPEVKAALDRQVRRQLSRLAQRIATDRRLQRLAAREWARLHKVEPLSKDPTSWLVVRPVGIEAAPIEVGRQAIRLGLGIQAEAEVVVAATPPDNPLHALPPLSFTSSREGRLNLNALGLAPWGEINVALTQRLVDRSVEFRDGTVLIIRRAEVSPWGRRVLLTIDLEAERGALYQTGGRLYLSAEPRLDAQAQRLILEHLDFTLETRNSLVALAGLLMEPSILEALQEHATIDLSPYVEQGRATAARAIERLVADMPNGVQLQAHVSEISISDLRVTQENLQIVVNAQAEVDAAISSLAF